MNDVQQQVAGEVEPYRLAHQSIACELGYTQLIVVKLLRDEGRTERATKERQIDHAGAGVGA